MTAKPDWAVRKDGPKRRRRTRRQLWNGEKRQWGSTTIHFKRQREKKLLASRMSSELKFDL